MKQYIPLGDTSMEAPHGELTKNLKRRGKVHLQERCTEDGKMSEDFMSIARNPKYKVYCLTGIGPIEAEEPEYRNGVSYMVKFEEEVV